MGIQDVGSGAFIGLAIGLFVTSPFWSFNVFAGKVKDAPFAAAFWGLVCFVALCVMCWSALFEGDTLALSAVISCAVVWASKISGQNPRA
jgi:hypothetical protein